MDLDLQAVRKYYERTDIQQELLRICKDREVQIWIGETRGRRPEAVYMLGDLKDLIKQGMTSFHVSEERWSDPLRLEPGMQKRNLDNLRKGWDMILDLDCKNLKYSQMAAELIIDAIKFHDIENFSVKFSVTGDTPVFIKAGNIKRLLPIKEAIEVFKSNKQLEILSSDEDSKLCFSKIYNYLVHKDKVYNLYYRQSDVPLIVTGHHSVFIWENGNIMQKYVKDIKKGDYVISYNKFSNFTPKVIQLDNLFSYNKKIINKKVGVTKELCRLIGYYLSEGHLADINYMVGFSFDYHEREYIDDCKYLLKSIVGDNVVSEHKPHPTSIQVISNTKQWYTFFKNYCGKGSHNKHLPNFVWDLPKDYFLELLKGYLRGDAHKKSPLYLTVKSVSKQLITELIWLCKMHGISANLYSEQSKPHLLNGNMFKGAFVFIMKITKRDLFINEFNIKRNKFSRLPADKVYPTAPLYSIYKQIQPGSFKSHRLENSTLKKKMASATRIEKVIKWFESFYSIEPSLESKRIINSYKQLIFSDIALLPVIDIFMAGEKMVYDVSVKGSERFFGGYYPILLHNSGNHGFHIAVPFEAFPDEVNGVHIKDFFPEGIKVISEYLKDMTSSFLAERMLKNESVSQIAKKIGKKDEELYSNGKFDPYQVISVDSVLISSRHLFRAPYSINEKSGLVSIPIHDIKKFDISKAKMENVKVELRFMDSEKAVKGEARKLLMQAFDWAMKKNKPDIKKFEREYNIPKDAVKADFFPPCILKLMGGIKEDGRKRAVFILINFFRHMGWTFEQIEAFLNEWNKKSYEQLREGYIASQVSWARRQNQKILPANCDNSAYYKGMAVCCPDDLCRMIKNPVQYATRKLNLAKRLEEEENKKKPKTKAKKKIDK